MSLLLLFAGPATPSGDVGMTAAFAVAALGGSAADALSFIGASAAWSGNSALEADPTQALETSPFEALAVSRLAWSGQSATRIV